MKWFSFLLQKTVSYRKKPPTKVRSKLFALSLCFLAGSVVLSGDVSRWRRKTLATIPHQLTNAQIDRAAAEITVKIHGEAFLGSGIILQKTKNTYFVITNQHVLRASSPPYKIQTPDGATHQGQVVTTPSNIDADLALLRFDSKNAKYSAASLGDFSQLKTGEPIFAAGFPAEARGNGSPHSLPGFTFTAGEVAIVLHKPLQEGYQIGYTNHVEKGMSGGPLLNRQGEVVGINGKHAYPLWDAPDFYEDNSQPCQPLQELITRSSLAIPVQKAFGLLSAPDVSKLTRRNSQNNSLLSTIATDSSAEDRGKIESSQHCQ